MNCRKFETIINDLARVSVMDAAEREMGLAHAESCARCASRLADEKALTLGLRAINMSAQVLEAPAQVESALLAAFRERAAAAPSLANNSPSLAGKSKTADAEVVVPMQRRTRPLWSWSTGVAAAAAVVLFAVVLGLLSLQSRPGAQPSSQLAGDEPAAIETEALTKETQPQQALASVAPAREETENEELPLIRESGRTPSRSALQSVANVTRRPKQRANSMTNAGGGSRLVNAASNAGETEIATDFMPLTYDGGATAMDSGHVVRVELPRSALVSMGLPMNIERAGERVKADVLLGDDGIARAIRFVR